ncbi:PREDICTED: nicotinamide/nicotinic acid mononucleotide adenylyltransferase 3 isoform X2 [Nicrophorus vespilloides]|uniref:Nicotinamide-nucleotide adenylyltransferase n=1 Tax=Nicrophorus vespilloides TaxID=110193 RepID=A0ABM1MRB6_NICVS|nr:PREDICTED: nicotinamide/nicotinic acid mononucleotide adenylyltransferase 3 isoform X2 [Nicrophorus vespilloides]
MTLNKVVLLACGSFNPPTNMHLRMFEIAKDHLHRMGQCLVVGGLMSPVHDAYGKAGLVSSTHRLAMLKMALGTDHWIKVSDWETNQESWTRTRPTIEYHQNHINSILYGTNGNGDEFFQNSINSGPVQVKLLCGADLLESFGTPGLWSDDDIEAIVGQHGLVVITRENCNPLKFIYNSDILTKYMSNITIVTEWITNEVSSTKIRRALRRSESVRYLMPDNVIDYIKNNGLYGSSNKNKYLSPLNPLYNNSNFLTPSPTDVSMDSPSPTSRCLSLCNNNLFSQPESIDVPDIGVVGKNQQNLSKHPGQAVKIVTANTGRHTIIPNGDKAFVDQPACLL